jgi:hypothetical protein
MESPSNAWHLIDFATYHVNYTTGTGRPRVNARLDNEPLVGHHSREPTEKGSVIEMFTINLLQHVAYYKII